MCPTSPQNKEKLYLINKHNSRLYRCSPPFLSDNQRLLSFPVSHRRIDLIEASHEMMNFNRNHKISKSTALPVKILKEHQSIHPERFSRSSFYNTLKLSETMRANTFTCDNMKLLIDYSFQMRI